MNNVLSLNIKKSFHSGHRAHFTLNVQMEISEGITVLFGPSGAGKTTILRAIAGITTPDEGQIMLNNTAYFDSSNELNRPIQDRKTGFLFQDYALFPHLTAQQNIIYGMKNASKPEKQAEAQKLLALFKIKYAADQAPVQLSGGEQQRVALARAIASEPDILLLDEPLSSVDTTTRAALLREIKVIQKKTSIPLIYVTHNQAEATRIGDAMFLIDQGKIIQQGKPRHLFNHPKSITAARTVGHQNVFSGRVAAQKPEEGLTTVEADDVQLHIPYQAFTVKDRVTLGIPSYDIIISREKVTQTSVRNILAGTIEDIIQDAKQTELIIDCGIHFKVSITHKTLQKMELNVGTPLYLLIKARVCRVLL